MPTNLDQLRTCYNALLGREPDGVAKTHWLEAATGDVDLQGVLTSILMSSEFFTKWKTVLANKSAGGAIGFFNEQSQFGEIGRLIRRMVNTTCQQQTVVDVGANGREGSNSYDLMRFFGWKGLLIEANPGRNAVIEAEFAGLDYRLVNCAVSDYTGEATFHLGVNNSVSSLQIEAAQGWGPVQGDITVPVRPLHVILAEHRVPRDFDLLSIDAEGEDVRIFNDTVASNYLPRWVIIEAVHDEAAPSLDSLGLTDAVRTSYEIVDNTPANLILRYNPG